VKENLLL